MRYLILLAIAACSIEGPATPQQPARRPLVTDNLPYLVDRAKVRAWHDHNDWCLRRQWPTTDEFVVCNRNPYLKLDTPPIYDMVRYNAEGKSIAYAVFTPVPCRMYGRCDRIYGRTVLPDERVFVDPMTGLLDNLAQRGRSVEPEQVGVPAMQQEMMNALVPEMMQRFGQPTWVDRSGYGMTWATPTSAIGLFVAGKGRWVVETHELRQAPAFTAAL